MISAESIKVSPSDRELLIPLITGGVIESGLTGKAAVAAARAHHESVKQTLPASAFRLTKGDPAIPTLFV
jgi:nicotinate phosphoribosyltransferase